jgi:molybdate transport system substrate-binding protein
MGMSKISIFLYLILAFAYAGCQPARAVQSSSLDTGAQAIPGMAQGNSTANANKHNLIVFAAASLNGAFKELGMQFEAIHPGIMVSFNFAGSQILRTQLEQGASADAVAFADQKNMDKLVAEQLVAPNDVQNFATNHLVIILPAGNPGDVRSIADLSNPGLKLILADASVPAGDYARQVLSKLRQDPLYGSDFSQKALANVVSNETDVKQVVTKIELGVADAGIVYVSDAVAAPDLLTFTIPNEFNATASYPIAVLADAPEPELAKEFLSYITSPAGQQVLRKWGFSLPTQ